jgi:hypothetical protein
MTLDVLRAQFRDGRCHHVVVPGVVPAATATSLRDAVDAAGFTAYDEPDRGRYEHNRGLAIPVLFDELRAIAAQITQQALCADHADWRRLRHRDYQLMKDDARTRPVAAHVEVTLDFSARATGQAEIVYSDGRDHWVVPQLPGAVAIVAREPWLFRYERYLNTAVEDAVVHRLHLSLSELDAGAHNEARGLPASR